MSIPLTVIFLIIPLMLCRKEEAISFKIVKGFCLGTFCAIITGYAFSLFKCFNLIYILFIFPPILLILYYFIEETRLADFQKTFSSKISFETILLCGAFLILFGMFIYMRAEKIFSSISLYYSDPFVHILFLKDFINGNFFAKAFYPQGYYAVLTLINKLSFTDPMDVVRLFGPIQSTVVVLALYAVILEFTRNRYVSLLAVIVPGLDSFGVFPGVFYRQILSLPQEYSMIFFLPIIFFACRYFTEKQAKDKKYFFICVCNALLIHINVAILAFFCFIGIVLSVLFFRFSQPKSIIKMFGIATGTAIIGVLPLILWDAAQRMLYKNTTTVTTLQRLQELFSNIKCKDGWTGFQSFIIGIINPLKDEGIWYNSLGANIICYTFIAGLLYVIGRMLWRRELEYTHFYMASFCISQFILLTLYYGKAYGLPSIIYFERTAMALTLVTFISIALLINEIYICFSKNVTGRLFLKICTICGAVILITCLLPQKEIKPVMLQYESALKAYVSIRESFVPGSWTIVSPVEEYPLVLGYGAHYEICNFVKAFSINEEKDKRTSLISMIKTKNVFVFVEKNPLLIWAVMPEEGGNLAKNDDDYRLYNNRFIMERKVAKLMQKYISTANIRQERINVFYENEDLIVYHISQM